MYNDNPPDQRQALVDDLEAIQLGMKGVINRSTSRTTKYELGLILSRVNRSLDNARKINNEEREGSES